MSYSQRTFSIVYLPIDHPHQHQRLVRLILEVPLPGRQQVLVQRYAICLGRLHLYADFDKVPAKDLVLVADQLFLTDAAAYDEITGLAWLERCLEGDENQVVVLPVASHTRQVHDNRDARLLKYLLATDAGSLQDAWCSVGPTGDHDQLPGLENLLWALGDRSLDLEIRIGHDLHTTRLLGIIEYHTYNLGLDKYVQVRMLPVLKLRVEERVGGILAFALRGDVPE